MAWRRGAGFGAAAALSLAGCGGQTAGAAAAAVDPPPTVENVAAHNRALGHMERYEYDRAEPLLRQLAEAYPHSERAVVDHAIALMHEEQKGAEGTAAPRLAEFVAAHPDATRARYVLGALLSLSERADEAIPHLEAARAAYAGDPYPAAYLAACKTVLAKTADGEAGADERNDKLPESEKKASKAKCAVAYREALAANKAVLATEPRFYDALARTARCLRTLSSSGPKEPPDELAREAAKVEASFNDVLMNPHGRIQNNAYHMMGPLADLRPWPGTTNGTVAEPPFFGAAVRLGGTAKWAPQPASLTVCDLDGDGRLDLFAAGGLPDGGNAVLLGKPDGTFALDEKHPLAGVKDVAAALWGDLDNDGRTDVVLLRREGTQVWFRTDRGWENRTATAGNLGGAASGALCDLDHDGDLDLVVADGERPRMYVNRSDGTFAEARPPGFDAFGTVRIVPGDFNGDDELDLALLGAHGGNSVLLRQADGSYQPMKGLASLGLSQLDALVAADPDGDGRSKLFGLSKENLFRWAPDSQGVWAIQSIGDLSARHSGGLAIADCGGDGRLDAVCIGPDGMQYLVFRGDDTVRPPAVAQPFAAWALANLDPASGPSLVGWDAAGPFVLPPATTRRPFAGLALAGDQRKKSRLPTDKLFRSNKSAVGTRVAVRAGLAWTRLCDLGASSAPGQSLQPYSVGVGASGQADFVSLFWSNGDSQTEVGIAGGQLHRIKEEDRTPPTSCPLLFAWNGAEWEFVTDFLAVGGLGYLVKPGVHAVPSDPAENVLLPEGVLKPQDGKLRLKALEAEPELALLDRAALVAYDVPPGWRLHLDERHNAVPEPRVTHEARFHRGEILPVRATDGAGNDVTAALAAADFRPAPPPPLDPRFPGRYARPQELTLAFAAALDAGPGTPALLADGWVEFPNSQAVLAAFQAGIEYGAPKLEARGADGRWRTVYAAFGYPAGMQRQMSLPLLGLPPGCRELRISGDLQISWDRFAIVRPEPCPEARRTPLALAAAELRRGGAPLYCPGRNGKPHDFDDARKLDAPLLRPVGFYTRYGDVRELLAAADDASATVGPGDEAVLEFAAPAPPPAGWSRRYVFESRGWCKGTDRLTKDSRTVEPLPSTGFPAAPRDALQLRYNTRWGN